MTDSDGSNVVPDDPSAEFFNILREPTASHSDREIAFEEMLSLPRGLWGEGKLVKFVRAAALTEARRALGRDNADRLDWESIAQDSLVELFRSAHKITGSLRAWLWGVVKNQTRHELSRHWPEITADEIPNWIPAPESDATALVPKPSEEVEAQISAEILSAINGLQPALKTVAEVLYVERLPRNEICERLGITQATLRKRIQRLHEALRIAVAKPGKTS